MENTPSNLTLEIMQILIPIVVSFAASSGFWLYIGKFKERKSLQTELLIGLAHDRIVWLGMKYISRGSISQDEYENLSTFLYKPYDALGGNGTAKRIMAEVEKLPIVTNRSFFEQGENDNDLQQ